MKDRNIDVIKYLVENSGKDVNILGMAKSINMDYKTAFSIVKRLEKGNIALLKKFGASNKVELNKIISPLIFEAEYERRKKVLRNKNLLVMLNNIKKDMGSALYVLLLFGSYAKSSQTERSDIDLMLIAPDGTEEEFEKKLHRTAKLMPLRIHGMTFSESQFLDMLRASEFNVGKEAAKNNVILHGIESYYEMI